MDAVNNQEMWGNLKRGANSHGGLEGSTDIYELEISQDHFLWALGSVCRLNQVLFSPKLISQQFPPPYTVASIALAGRALGFAIEITEKSTDSLNSHELPCFSFLVEGSENESGGVGISKELNSSSNTLLVLLFERQQDQQLVYFDAGTNTPKLLNAPEAACGLYPLQLKFSVVEEEPKQDELDSQPKKFGYRWFIPELVKYKPIWRDVLLASLAIQIIALATPIFTQVIIDKVIVHHTLNTLIVIGVALCMFMIFTAAMTWVRQYLVLHTGNRIDAILGSHVFSHLFNLPLKYFEHRPTGTLVARIQGMETIREFITGAAVTLILDLPFLFIFLAIMFYYSWQLTLIVLSVILAISVLSLAITPTLRERLNKQFQHGARNQAFLTEYINSMETVKSLQMEPQLRQRFGGFLSTYLQASFKSRSLSNTYNVAANTLEQFQTLAVLCVGAWLVMTTDTLTIGMLVAFQMFASRLSQPMLRMVGLWQQFQQANIAVKRLGDVMDAPAEPYAVTPVRTQSDKGHIECQSLSFRYSADLPYLYQKLDLTVESGSAVAIMGPSGSGKSTLAKLLQGFHRPSDGRIKIDGRDVRHLAANELRQYFGVVPQETQLFSGTVHENLIVANPGATFEQITQACRMAEIHEVIEQLPKGYQTELGERGVGLSGGQKQRLAIARALLKRPGVLIFDEATSALDQSTAEQFARTVNKLRGKVTLLFITHQLPKGLMVDKVVTLGSQLECHLAVDRKDQEETPLSSNLEHEPS
ncbi:peptidase domain-containing ABC transporter [Marinimicrobium sp. LS-A18]|uniref:peptidase domain-containing ABC transporter n=1 Tax=Marinimicrobium sp. LS-A18 TaxID=1381596 RepID=UPI00046343A6|nr:peptidase domain-containing ABC transporter [Marinimicrobium sp. LS-A18]